jgi:membrane protein implicated in regulation of membrane protease activity
MTRRQILSLLGQAAAGAALVAGAFAAKGHLGVFWHEHGDAVAFGGVLFAAFLALLLVFGRVSRKRLLRVRGQRDRARDRLFAERASLERADDADAYRPVWTTGAAPEADEFEQIMRHNFVAGGER